LVDSFLYFTDPEKYCDAALVTREGQLTPSIAPNTWLYFLQKIKTRCLPENAKSEVHQSVKKEDGDLRLQAPISLSPLVALIHH